MRTAILVLLLVLTSKYSEAQSTAIIQGHMNEISAIISKYSKDLDPSSLQELNAEKWDANDFDESFYLFFDRFWPDHQLEGAYLQELNNWKIAVKKDITKVTENDIRNYIKTIKKTPNSNLLMYYYMNVYANFFFSQKSMQDHYPKED